MEILLLNFVFAAFMLVLMIFAATSIAILLSNLENGNRRMFSCFPLLLSIPILIIARWVFRRLQILKKILSRFNQAKSAAIENSRLTDDEVPMKSCCGSMRNFKSGSRVSATLRGVGRRDAYRE